jgi:hypothetical protein
MIVFVVGTPVVVVTYVGFATTTGLVVVVVVNVVLVGAVAVPGGGEETRCDSGSEAQPARKTRAPQNTEAGAKRWIIGLDMVPRIYLAPRQRHGVFKVGLAAAFPSARNKNDLGPPALSSGAHKQCAVSQSVLVLGSSYTPKDYHSNPDKIRGAGQKHHFRSMCA